jgi:hypothetical protein
MQKSCVVYYYYQTAKFVPIDARQFQQTNIQKHRHHETGNTQAVMNGEIMMFIEAYLKEKASPKNGHKNGGNNNETSK